jgi:hypothetical protein
LTVPASDDFTDGLLRPGEAVEVPFIICFLERQPFRFEVAVVGAAESHGGA